MTRIVASLIVTSVVDAGPLIALAGPSSSPPGSSLRPAKENDTCTKANIPSPVNA